MHTVYVSAYTEANNAKLFCDFVLVSCHTRLSRRSERFVRSAVRSTSLVRYAVRSAGFIEVGILAFV